MMIRTASSGGSRMALLAGLVIPWLGFCLLTGCASAPAPTARDRTGRQPAAPQAAARRETSNRGMIEPPVGPFRSHAPEPPGVRGGWLVASRDRFRPRTCWPPRRSRVAGAGGRNRAASGGRSDLDSGTGVRAPPVPATPRHDTLVWSANYAESELRFLITILVAPRQAPTDGADHDSRTRRRGAPFDGSC